MALIGTGHGCGKVILFGEHIVVYGHDALVAGIGVGVRVSIEPAARDRVVVPAWGLDESSGPVVEALRAIAGTCSTTGALAVHADAKIPGRAGLGSSAALSVAIARALGATDVSAAAGAGERVFHGFPSGIDVAASLHGGIGLYSKAGGWRAAPAQAFSIAICPTGEPKDTAARVAGIAARRDSLRAGFAELGALVGLAAADVARGDVEAIGARMNLAEEILESFDLGSPGITRAIAAARAAGAWGAKLTGAGGGGAVIAVGPDVDRIVAALHAAGFSAAFSTVLSGSDRP